MATKGYHQYRGRGRGGKTLLVVFLLIVLLCAALFLVGQRYLVYDADGTVRLELPFLNKHSDSVDGEEIPDQDIHIQYGDDSDEEDASDGKEDATPIVPQKPELQVLQAQELPYSCLNSDPAAQIAGKSAVVINIKRADGTLAYPSSISLAAGILHGSDAAMANLKAITGSECYTVARISALCDVAFAEAHHEAAISYADGSLWWDNYNRTWLNPASEVTQQYLCDLAAECAQLGFDEILLDQFRYPIEGDLTYTNAAQPADRVAVLTQLVQKIREAAPSIAVSVILPGSIGSDTTFHNSGLSAQLFTEGFDRVYAPQSSYAYFWLTESLGADFDRTKRLVTTAYAPTDGSYLILYG